MKKEPVMFPFPFSNYALIAAGFVTEFGLFNYFLASLIIDDFFIENVSVLIVVPAFPFPLVSYFTLLNIFLSKFKFY